MSYTEIKDDAAIEQVISIGQLAFAYQLRGLNNYQRTELIKATIINIAMSVSARGDLQEGFTQDRTLKLLLGLLEAAYQVAIPAHAYPIAERNQIAHDIYTALPSNFFGTGSFFPLRKVLLTTIAKYVAGTAEWSDAVKSFDLLIGIILSTSSGNLGEDEAMNDQVVNAIRTADEHANLARIRELLCHIYAVGAEEQRLSPIFESMKMRWIKLVPPPDLIKSLQPVATLQSARRS